MKIKRCKNISVLSVIVVTLIFFICFLIVINDTSDFRDTIIYKGETYVCLEYNQDIFTYNFNSNDYYEEDVIHAIFHDKWDIVYFNGDLFIHENEVEKAKKYYANDKNYEWFIVLDENDLETMTPISLSLSEIDFIYDMDNMEKSETTTFDEIKQFASLTKISKDKTVFSIISLAYYKDSWYWKTEIMTDTNDSDQEYIIKLPETLNEKIIMAIDK